MSPALRAQWRALPIRATSGVGEGTGLFTRGLSVSVRLGQNKVCLFYVTRKERPKPAFVLVRAGG
jgi:hypothetical protein